jgi:hypothetical protein
LRGRESAFREQEALTKPRQAPIDVDFLRDHRITAEASPGFDTAKCINAQRIGMFIKIAMKGFLRVSVAKGSVRLET